MPKRVLPALLAVALAVAACFRPEVQRLVPAAVEVERAVRDGWALVEPGGKLHPTRFLESRGHLVVEGCLLLVITYLLVQGSFKPRAKESQPLTDKARSGRVKGRAGARGGAAAGRDERGAGCVSQLGGPVGRAPGSHTRAAAPLALCVAASLRQHRVSAHC